VRLSSYNLCTDLGTGEFLLTNLLTRTVVRCTAPQREFLHSLQGNAPLDGLTSDEAELLEQLVRGLFVLPDDFDELGFVAQSHATARSARMVKTVVIAPTMKCNMSCHYCFERKGDGCLGLAHEEAIVRRLADSLHSYEGLHVQWFGGEPLLELGSIRRLSEALMGLCGDIGKRFSAEIITNGALLTAATAEELSRLGVREAQVTFEGAQRLHDRIRFTSDRSGSYESIVEAIRSTSQFLAVNVRVHVAPYSVDGAFELLVDLANRGLAKNIRRLYFSPLFDYSSTRFGGIQFRVEPRKFYGAREFSDVQTELIRKSVQLGFSTGDPLAASYGLCIAMLDGTEVYGPSGAVTKCYLDTDVSTSAFESLDGSTKNADEFVKWAEYDYTADDECRTCQFAPVCLGGCPSQRMHQAKKELVCTPLRFNFHERMRLAFGSTDLSRDAASASARAEGS
jgi:uncharacterized protein